MKTNFKKKLLVPLLLLAGFTVRAQHINIQTTGGEVIMEELNSIEKMTLPNDNLVIHLSNSSPLTIGLYSIQKIYFDQETSASPETEPDQSSPSILMNPVTEEVEIANLRGHQVQAYIYSILGEMLVKTWVNTGESRINIQNLPAGLYILKLENTTLKFVKK